MPGLFGFNVTQTIAGMPLWLSGFLTVILPTAAMVGALVFVQSTGRLDRWKSNNEVASANFAAVGVIFAVLLGLVVISVWEKYTEAYGAASREAGAIASLYRLAAGTDGSSAGELTKALTHYAKAVIEKDWPAMARAKADPGTFEALNGIYAAAFQLEAPPDRSQVLLGAILEELDSVTDSRRERLDLAGGVIPGILWLVLVIGALTTLSFTFLFVFESLRIQTLMTGLLSLVIFLSLFVAISVSHPYTGPIAVRPVGLIEVLQEFDAGP